MAIEIKEYVGAKFLNVKSDYSSFNKNLSESSTVQTYIDEGSLMVDIESMHSIITRNNTFYDPMCLKESIPYWTNPYDAPVIMHHKEADGVTIGRVKSAKYIEHSPRTSTPALELTANVGDPQGKQGLKNGTLATVSIGIIAHDIRCSICGTNIAEEGMCEHEKGEMYDNNLCYWIIKKMEPKELSYVIVPSDKYAHNIRIYDAVPKNNKNEVKESMAYLNDVNPFDELSKELAESVGAQEGSIVDEEVTKKQTNVAKTEEPNEVESIKASKEEPTKNESKEENEVESKEKVKGEPKEESKEEPEKELEEEPKEELEEEPKEELEEEPKEELEEEPKEELEEEGEGNKEELNKEIEEIKKEKEELAKEVKALKVENEALTAKLKAEKGLRESAETQLLSFKAERKNKLVEKVTSLRAELGLPEEDKNSLMESSEDSLNSALKNLTEFVSYKKQMGFSTITSPVAVSESLDNTTKKETENVKESQELSNINFEEGFEAILSRML